MKKLIHLVLILIVAVSAYMITSCTGEDPIPDPVVEPEPVVVFSQEIIANYTSFAIIPNEEYRFASESVINATYWRYDMKFYKEGVDVTSEVMPENVSMLSYEGVSSFFYNGGSIINDDDVSGLTFGFKSVEADRVYLRIKGGDSTPMVSTKNNTQIHMQESDFQGTLPENPATGVGTSEPNIDMNDCVDAETEFGLIPDLGTDQTAAFSNMLNSTETHIYIKSGEYLIHDHIVVDAGKEKKILGGSNTVIKHTISTNETRGIYSNSALHLEHLIFDYDNGPCSRGLLFRENSGTIILQHVTFRNIYDTEISPKGTLVLSIAAHGNLVHLDGIRLENMRELGDDVIGTSSGNLTGIYLYEYPTKAPINGYIRNVVIDNMHNINEDGDYIVDDVSCIFMISSAKPSDSRIEVSRVRAYNYGKRAIKIHCNGYVIDDVVGHADTYEGLSLIGVNDGSGTINNVTVTGYSNTGVALFGTQITCTNVTSHVQKSPLYEDAFPFFIGDRGEDIIIDGFDFSGERVLFHNPHTVSDAKVMTDITFRNGTMKSNKVAGFQFNKKSKGFKNLNFENVKVEQTATDGASAVFLDCSNLDYTSYSRSLAITECSMKNAGPVENGMILKYVNGFTIDDFTVESGGSYSNVISLQFCVNGVISGIKNDATADNLIEQINSNKIEITGL